jgi:hypothetical protein
MRNLEEGTHSIMRFTNVKSSGELPARIFDPALFYLSN